jgi:type II secretory pathway pseudopilin PulG
MLRPLSQIGDTIVEVMIVLAILGSAIGISYATANRSLLNARQAQENSQATEYVQSQVEALRYLAPNSNTNVNDNIFRPPLPDAPNAVYCIHDATANNPLAIYPIDPCTFGSIPYTVLVYNCDQVTTNPCDNPNIAPNSDTFVMQATWPDVTGQGNDSVTLVYRVHAQ